MMTSFNPQSLSHPINGNNYGYNQEYVLTQTAQPPIAPNVFYPSQGMPVAQMNQLCITNNLLSILTQQQALKQEELRISHQRHVDEMEYTHSHPHIHHHCAIIDRLDKNDTRYTNFSAQVKKNDSHYETVSGTFEDKDYIALEMNMRRLSVLGSDSISASISRNSSAESCTVCTNECAENMSDEESNGVDKHGYLSPSDEGVGDGYVSISNSVCNNDELPTCNPGSGNNGSNSSSSSNNSLSLSTESNGIRRLCHHDHHRPLLTCLGLLEDWCGSKSSEDINTNNNDDNNNNNSNEDESNTDIDYRWISMELEKLERLEMDKKRKAESAKEVRSSLCGALPSSVVPTYTNHPLQVPLCMGGVPLSMAHHSGAVNTSAMTLPFIHFPSQMALEPNRFVSHNPHGNYFAWPPAHQGLPMSQFVHNSY